MVKQGLESEFELIEAVRREQHGGSQGHIGKVLHIVRKHLGMDVGFVSEFADGQRVFRYVDSAAERSPIVVGGSDPIEDSYCQRVADGRLPQLICDACENLEAMTLAVTRKLPVGAHLSVPIHLSDGRLYGTFCCFSFTPDHSLTERDLHMLTAFAAIAAELIQTELELEEAKAQKVQRISNVLAHRRIEMLFQPMYTLANDRLVGFEALARFPGPPARAPDKWFAEADDVGLGTQLEFLAIETAMDALAQMPPAMRLSLNLSPASIMAPEFAKLFDRAPLDRLVLEVTEHAPVESYEAFDHALQPFRDRGLQLAVDDAGAGHSSLRHVLALRPDIIKLDMSLTHRVDSDPARHALAMALTVFGRSVGARITAEGVETEGELATLRTIGVSKAQGYLLGRPLPLAEALAAPQPAALGASRAAA